MITEHTEDPMQAVYAPDMTMHAARDLYFEANGFGADGGYNDTWVDFKLGPLPMPFPNSPSRIAAVKFHDLHHVLTGYATNIIGEFEISAWEIGAGCKNFVAAWALNLGGTIGGVLTAPRRTFAAFVRGRRSSTLYGLAYEQLLDARVGELRARHIESESAPPRISDVLLFACAAAAGLVVATVLFTVIVPLVPVGLVAGWLRRRRAPRVAA